MHETIRDRLIKRNASLVGFADITMLPEAQRMGFPRAISIGIALDPVVVSRIPSGPHIDYSIDYNHLNKNLDVLAEDTAWWLEQAGFRAFPLSRKNAPYSNDTSRTILPYKTVARLAGLGFIGKNALLITKEYGAAQRFTTVLTDAPFATNDTYLEPLCKSCTACREICPGSAIHGVTWDLETDRDTLVDHKACQEAVKKRGVDLPLRSVTCGLCVAACPFTKAYLNRSLKK
ncbi:MAG: 4Fe-4S double cluster binding domain-containing protein [Christensenellaceae bacterium]|jgi:epoxyqueuosine reductase